MNTDEPENTEEPRLAPYLRVLQIQTKLHRWAAADLGRRFDDLYNFVYDPDVLAEAWRRVRGNRGSRAAGVDGNTTRHIESVRGVEAFLADLRADLKARRFQPLPVRERMIPKTGGKVRYLGIPTVRDRVVQAALKLVLEPIFEADFKPCSYGFRPKRRTQDAIEEIHFLNSGPRDYGWVLEGDIEACFDNIDHTALMGRIRRRVGDKRVLGLVKAFLKAGVLSEDLVYRDTRTGTPQGGILSPLLANIALSVLDDHFVAAWESFGTEWGRRTRRRKGLPTYRLVRYADDFVVLVMGSRADVEALQPVAAEVLARMGLRLSAEKTRIVHIDEGFDFLGFRIQRHTKRGTNKRYVYTYPSKKSLATIKAKIRVLTRDMKNQPLSVLLQRLNPVLQGWTTYFQHGVSKRTYDYLSHFTWRRVICWIRHKHPRMSWKQLRRRYLDGWWPTEGEINLFRPGAVTVTRYRYRGNIPSPWATTQTKTA